MRPISSATDGCATRVDARSMTAKPSCRCFTRCQHCRAILPLEISQLAQAGGMVRCGGCGRTLNALATLYPEFPDDNTTAVRPTGMPPMLQPHVEQEDMIGSSSAGHKDDQETPPEPEQELDRRGPVLNLNLDPEPAPAWSRFVWPLAGLLLLGLLGLQLFGPEQWRVDPAMLGLAPAEPINDADAVRLVSRDMHPHPSIDDAWVISAVLVNRARSSIAWPRIELRLFDSSQQVVARRRLSPADYLSEDTDLESGFPPDLLLPVVLEVSVAGSRPAGFSMTFHD